MDSPKQRILFAFIAHFEKELSALIQSARAAHQAATHEESRAEDRHDTFAIEASYLAAGQATRVQDLHKSLTELKDLTERLSLIPHEAVEVGSLVVLECSGKRTYSLITQTGGGTQIPFAGNIISLVTPFSPLGENVIGLKKGDEFTVESKSGPRDHRVTDLS